jgi:hypothetical protein
VGLWIAIPKRMVGDSIKSSLHGGEKFFVQLRNFRHGST